MKRFIVLILFLATNISLLDANPNIDSTPLQYNEQKRVYNEQKRQADIKAPIYTETTPLKESQSPKGEPCIEINKITLVGNTLLAQEKIDNLFASYLHKCNSLTAINNLVKKINNIYIKEGYITSRAYIKPQKLSTGVLKISTMEGKIEEVINKGVNSSLIIGNLQDSYFDLREIETYIEQLNRLESKKVVMNVQPGSKVGYSKIVLVGKRVGYPIHGYIGTDNYTYGNFKRYQINSELSWENPLNMQDILRVSFNVSNKQDKANRTGGYGVSYGLPIYKGYIELGYNKFKYSHMIEGLNKEYLSEGNTKEYYLQTEYKLLHTKHQKGKVAFRYSHKKVENYFDTILLDTTSYQIDRLKLSYTHELIYPDWSLSAMVGFEKSLNASYVNKEETNKEDLLFNKVIFSVTANYKILKGKYPLDFKSSLYGQYGKEDMIASEQIGIGGVYSVRGFKANEQLSSNFGFYIRNELSTEYRFNNSFVLQPYLGLDYGWAKKGKLSNGGQIAGGAIGCRISLYGANIDIFAAKPLFDSSKTKYLKNGEKVKKELKGTLGVSVSYKF